MKNTLKWPAKILMFIMVLLMVAANVSGCGQSSQTTQRTQPARSVQTIDYVALGDSLAAGYAPTGKIDKGYPDFIVEKLKNEGILGDYRNLGVTGFTTRDVLNRIDPANTANAEIIAAISKAEVITLDIGANDLLSVIPALAKNPTQMWASVQNVAGNVEKIIRTLKGINPNAKIYVMGYYDAFPYKTEVQHTLLVSLIKVFNQAILKVAEDTGSTYVDTFDIMDKHLTDYLPKDDIHPNISGYEAIGNEFWALIQGDF